MIMFPWKVYTSRWWKYYQSYLRSARTHITTGATEQCTQFYCTELQDYVSMQRKLIQLAPVKIALKFTELDSMIMFPWRVYWNHTSRWWRCRLSSPLSERKHSTAGAGKL